MNHIGQVIDGDVVDLTLREERAKHPPLLAPRTERLWIPGRMPALNEIIAAKGFGRRATGGKYAAMKKLWTGTVAQLAEAQGLKPWPTGAHLRFTLAEPNKRRDPDGAASGAMKMTLDGLVLAGILPTDGWGGVLSISLRWYLDPKDPGVRVLLSDVEHA